MAIKRPTARRAFTLVEMLIVIFIIGVLAGMLLPAIHLARESARNANCQSNLRQFGQAMLRHAETNNGQLSSGAFSWEMDGCLTEKGWVADAVTQGAAAGRLLCPSNPLQLSDSYAGLHTFDTAASGVPCVNYLGSPVKVVSGLTIENACRKLNAAAPGTARVPIVDEFIYDKNFNTNYCATWFLVRGSARLNSEGNLNPIDAACTVAGFPAIMQRNFTKGPIFLNEIDASPMGASFIPLLGDANQSQLTLSQDVAGGDIPKGSALASSMTFGPALREDTAYGNALTVPVFPAMTAEATWYPVWATQVRQDYRAFAPVHRGQCNVLFADGRVGTLSDSNGDGFINNGFRLATGGFTDVEEEVKVSDLESLYSIIDKNAHLAN